MRFKLVGTMNTWSEGRRTIMKSTDIKVLENIKEMLEHFPEYKKLEIVQA